MGWQNEKNGITIMQFIKAQEPHVSRFLEDLCLPWRWLELGHSYVNLYSEASKYSYYHFSHFAAIWDLILYIVIIWLVATF